jgi:hypothetical protein
MEGKAMTKTTKAPVQAGSRFRGRDGRVWEVSQLAYGVAVLDLVFGAPFPQRRLSERVLQSRLHEGFYVAVAQ